MAKVIEKLMSGRWLMTISASVVFAVTSINGSLPPEDVKLIIGIIITFYFTKGSDKGQED